MIDSIQTVAVIGAGALGLLYTRALREVPDTDTFFVADEGRCQAIARTGFRINGEQFDCDTKTPAQLTSPADLVIVAVKNHHLDDIGPLLDAAVGPGTVVVSVLNGIDSEAFIEQRCPQATVLYCIALGTDATREGNELRYTAAGRLVLGAKSNDREDPYLTAVCDLLARAGIACVVPDDIHRQLWWKWMVNIGMNQVSAVTGATYGVFREEPAARELMEAAMREVVAVAGAEGIALSDEGIQEWYSVLNTLGADGKTSMLQDVEARRRTEAPAFGGRLIELARRHGVPVPVNETLVRIIAVRELLYPRS